MSDCQHRNAIGQANEDDLIGKVVDWKAAHIPIGNTWHERSRRWELLQVFESTLNLCGESFRDLLVSLPIPGDRLAKLMERRTPKADTLQRDSTSL